MDRPHRQEFLLTQCQFEQSVQQLGRARRRPEVEQVAEQPEPRDRMMTVALIALSIAIVLLAIAEILP